MKLSDIDDYEYSPNPFDLTNYFTVEEKTEENGSVTTYFNLNDGVFIDGIDKLPKDRLSTYRCRHGDNLRFISYREYGSVRYWWMIAKINHIEDSFAPLEAGSTLYLLPKEHMNYIMNVMMGKTSANA